MNTTGYAALVFGAGACYGVLSTCVKLAYAQGFNLADVSGAQYFYGMTLLWIAILCKDRHTLSLKTLLPFFFLSIPMAMTTIFYYESLETLSASLAVVFLFQSIWMGTVVDIIRQHAWPTWIHCLSILMALGGTMLAAGLFSGQETFSFQIGMLWGLLAACSYTAEIVGLNTFGKNVPPLWKSAIMSTTAALFTFFLLPPVFLESTTRFLDLAPFGIVLGLFGVALPPLLLSTGMPHISPGLGSLLAASELPVALLLSLFILGESISLLQGLGILFILSGIVIGNVKKKN